MEFPYQKTPFLGGLIGKIGSEKMPEMIYLHRSFSCLKGYLFKTGIEGFKAAFLLFYTG